MLTNRSAKLCWIARCCAVPVLLLACQRERGQREREVLPQKSWLTCQAPPSHEEQGFGAAMRAAMIQMDEAMNSAPSGNSDRDFAAMMVPHHQGAVDMALVELRFGHDERLRRLAAGIIVEQRSEIALMQQILTENKPSALEPSATSQTLLASDTGARQ